MNVGQELLKKQEETLQFNLNYYKSETKKELIKMFTALERDESDYLDRIDELETTTQKQAGVIEYLQGLLNDLQKETTK